MSKPTLLGAILLAAAAGLLGAAAPATPREYPVFKADRPPVIDGYVRDDIWRAAPWSGDFIGPRGAKPDADTQFAMAWDENFLYVAVRCKEPKSGAIHADITGRDPRIVNDDHVEILLASSDEPTAAFQIFLNAGRGRMVQWVEEGRPANAPDAEGRRFRLEQAGLDSAARAQSGEWVVEAAIPLPKVEWPLKEGMTYLGNICRVRPGATVKEMTWNPVRGSPRSSAGFGRFKLCGPAPKAPPIVGGDDLCLLNGDRINGTLVSLAGGEIQFTSPSFAEAVSVTADDVQRLDLAWTETDAAPSRFYLNNGDQISGAIASLTAETVGIESPSLGRISVPRALLSNIASSGFWLDSRFQSGVLSPWEVLSGTCTFGKGTLRLSGATPAGPHPAVLALPLHQDKTVTLIADYDPTPPFTPLRIQLFADQAQPQMQIQNGIMLEVAPAARFVVYNDGRPTVPPRPRQRISPVPMAERIRVKVMYDPADGEAKAWYNDNQVAEVIAPQGPKEGEYVVFAAARPLAIHRLAVYCGLPAPDRPMTGLKPGEMFSYLTNGDTLRASQVEFADGNFVFTTEFGPMKVRPDRVVGIAFPAKADKPPAASAAENAAALVETSGSRLALEVEAITDEFVIGKSPDLGAVKLPRRVVKSISFPAS